MDRYDLLILGGGPGGYVAAIRAAQLGMHVGLIEREEVGGVCLNWGCIPSKALLRNAEVLSLIRRSVEFGIDVDGVRPDYRRAYERSREVVQQMVQGVQFLLQKHGVAVVKGSGTLRSRSEIDAGEGRVLQATHILLATGARGRLLPGIEPDGRRIITSREALALTEAPRSAVIIGAGAVGAEFAYIWRTYGCEVTLIEALPHILPQEEPEIARLVAAAFDRAGIRILAGTNVAGARATGDGVEVALDGGGGQRTLHADLALVGVGVQGNSDGIGLEAAAVQIERSFVPVDAAMATNMPGVFAIGDLTGPPLLAHVASAQGVVAVELMAGLKPQPLDYVQMPRATYCQPEVASIGLTEAQARERGLDLKIGRFPLRANGRALAAAEPDGVAKMVVDAYSGELLGVHLVGHGVSELLGELSLARALEATGRSLGAVVHAHPTVSEVVKEAGLSAEGEAIHVWQRREAVAAQEKHE